MQKGGENESNQLRVQGRLTGSMKRKVEQDLEKGYKQAELVKMAFDCFYSQKEPVKSRY